MVLPLHVKCAARRGNRAVVAAWLESGGSINEVDTKNGRTMLLLATIGPATNADEHCDFDERHVALARLLVERGADVNLTSANGSTPLHYTSYGRSESGPAMVALLLKAGANVLVTNSRRHTPLTLVLTHLAKHGPSESRTGMEIALLLLRAIPSLDHARTGAVTGTVYSAEETLDWAEECGRAHAQANPPLSPNNCIDALRAVVAGVRSAGGWRAYDRKPRAAIMRLRSLALRRRAFLPSALPQRFACGDRVVTRPKTAKACLGTVIAANSIQIVVKLDDAKGFEAYPPEGGEDLLLSANPYTRSLDFLVRCPPEIAWHILSYWRCQYPIETSIIDDSGVH